MEYAKEYTGKNVLVTGGAGCIGGNLSLALARLDVNRVIILDDLSAAPRWNVKRHDKIEFVEGSVLNDEVLRRVFKHKIDIVFHLAAHFANQNSVDNPEKDLMVNGLGTLKLLEYAQLAHVKRFVLASSGCSVYGSQAPLPLKEDYVSIKLDTPYQITKLLGELYCYYYQNHYGLPIAVARYFNVYGAGEIPGKYRNVIPNFIWMAMQGESLPITGTGEETRDFTYVDDIIDGTLRLGVMKEAVGEAFNLASGKETKIIDVADIINDLTSNASHIVFCSRRDWDKGIRRCASIDKARNLIGYNPKVEICAGIPEVYKWIMGLNREQLMSSMLW